MSSTPPTCSQAAGPVVPDLDAVEDLEVIGDDLDSLLDSFTSEQEPAEVKCAIFVLAEQKTHVCC